MSGNNFSWEKIIKIYITHLEKTGLAKRSIRLHYDYIKKLKNISTPCSISYRELESTFKSSWKSETRRSAFNIYRKFFRWLFEFDYREDDLSTLIGKVKCTTGIPKPITEEALKQGLANACEREKIMIMCGAYLGLRCCEICKIHSNDWNGKVLRVIGKGNKERLIPVVHPRLIHIFNNLNGYLFPNIQRGGHIQWQYVSKKIAQNLPDNYTAHSLRHYMATKVYNSSKDLLGLSLLLGHSSPTTTKRYIQISSDYLYNIMRESYEDE